MWIPSVDGPKEGSVGVGPQLQGALWQPLGEKDLLPHRPLVQEPEQLVVHPVARQLHLTQLVLLIAVNYTNIVLK